MAGCAIAASCDLTNIRIALFGVAESAILATEAEAALTSAPHDIDVAIAALEAIAFTADMHNEAATKRHLAGVALRRAWAEVIE